ncbi:peptide chain release factor H [Paludibaculum fermentans]|uniref:peptide chain release factor H n=1 Tax=Paludibaculum fermentans TaxID=1473598 RepID=UPI003EBDEC6C
MTHNPSHVWLQVSAGQGPAECAWAVVKTLETMQAEAQAAGLQWNLVELEAGPQPGTASSALVALTGEGIDAFTSAWCGTIQWIAKSPFRPAHKRRNWFVAIEALPSVEESTLDPKDVRWETMRASGPGGQHVNRTESAVRVTHLPTGLQAVSANERSQHRNRQLALARLSAKLSALQAERLSRATQQRWQAHQNIERGNPIRVFRSPAG